MRLLGLLLLSALAAFAAPRVQIQDTVNDQDGVPFVGVVTIRLNQSCYQADGQYVSAARPTVVRLGTGTDQTHNAGQLDVSLYPNATGSCGPPDVPADEGTSYQVRYEDTVTPNANVRSEYWVIPAVAGPLRIMDIMQPLPPPTPGIAVQPQNILAGGAGDGWHMIFNLLNGRWTPTPFASLANPMTQTNQMIRGGASGTPVALAAPITIGHVLTFTATGLEWVEPASGGVVDHSLLTNLDFPNSGHTGFAAEVHASRHQFGGADPVATATPAPNAIPQADAGGTIAVGWLPSLGTIYVPTNRNLTGGSGVASIGDLSQDRTVNLDFLSEPLDAAPAGTSALLIEISAGVFRRVLWSSLPGAGGGGLDNAYTQMTDGTTSSGAVGADTFKYRALNNKLGITVTDNDATHGDNALFQINEANLVLSNMGGQVLDSQVPNNISLDNLTQITVRNYSDLQNIPATFPPSAHNHPISEVTGLQTALDGKEPSLGTGTAAQFLNGLKAFVAIDWTDIANKPATFAPSAHATSHQQGGADEVAVATPAANAIAKADADSRFSEAWMKHRPALVTSTPHSFTAADRDRRVIFNSASAIASSIPGCGTAGFEDGFEVIVYNWGAGAVTVTPGVGTILGGSNLQLIEQTGGILTCRAAATNYEVIIISDNLVTSTGNIPNSRVDFPIVPGSSATTLEDVQNAYLSAGIASGGAITDGGTQTIDVAGGGGLVRTGPNASDPARAFEWPPAAGFAIPSNETRWVIVEYNAGSPQVAIRTAADYNQHSEVLLGLVHNDAGELQIANVPWLMINGTGRVMHWFSEVWGLQRSQRRGGLNITPNGTFVQMDEGSLFAVASEFQIPAFDSSGTDRFDGYFRDGVGGYTKEVNRQTWPTSQYDNGSGALQPLSAGQYGTLWFFLLVNGDIGMVYGYSNEPLLETARNEERPAAPGMVGTLGTYFARWVIRQGGAQPVLVESTFQQFGSGATALHNELLGRTAADAHPTTAITGLDTELASKSTVSSGVANPTANCGVGEKYLRTDVNTVWQCSSPNTWTETTGGGGGGGAGMPSVRKSIVGLAQVIFTAAELGFNHDRVDITCWDTATNKVLTTPVVTKSAPAANDITVDFGTAGNYTCDADGSGSAGNVVSTEASTLNALARYVDTGGLQIKNSLLTVDDAGLASSPSFQAGATGTIGWATRSGMASPADGQIRWDNAADNAGIIWDFSGFAAIRNITIPDPGGSASLPFSTNNLGFFSNTTSDQLLAIITDNTGTGLLMGNDSPAITTPAITGAIGFEVGVRQTFGPDGNVAGVNIGSVAGDPITLVNGDTWYNSTTNKMRCRENGASVDCIASVSAHNILSATHSDTTGAGGEATGDLFMRNATNQWTSLPKGTQYQVLLGGATTPGYGALPLNQPTAISGILPFANGGFGINSGTSGGVPYFPTTGTVGSSALLAASTFVMGGGAGNPPTTGGGYAPATAGTGGTAPANAGISLFMARNDHEHLVPWRAGWSADGPSSGWSTGDNHPRIGVPANCGGSIEVTQVRVVARLKGTTNTTFNAYRCTNGATESCTSMFSGGNQAFANGGNHLQDFTTNQQDTGLNATDYFQIQIVTGGTGAEDFSLTVEGRCKNI